MFIGLVLMTATIASISYAGLVEGLEKVGKQLVKPTISTEGIFVSAVEERQKQLEELKIAREAIEKEQKEFDESNKQILADIKSQTSILQPQLDQQPDNAYITNKLTLFNETYQAIKDLQRMREQLLSIIDETIKLTEEQRNDPEFKEYIKKRKIPADKLIYSFEDVRVIYDAILDQEKRVDQLGEEEKNVSAELENRKRTLAATIESVKKKKEDLDNNKKIGKYIDLSLTPEQTQELSGIDSQLYNYLKVIDTLRVKISSARLSYIALQIYIAKGQLATLKEHLKRIKPSIRVSEIDVQKAFEDLNKKKQQQFAEKEALRQTIEQLITLQKIKQQELNTASQLYGISVDKDLLEWNKEVVQTADWYIGFCQTGLLNTSLSLLQKKQELADAQSMLLNESLKHSTIQVNGKETYHKITLRKFTTEEEISQEIKQYDIYKADEVATLSINKEKINQIADLLNVQKRALDNISMHRQEVQKQKELLFKGRTREYLRCIEIFNQAETFIKEEIDILGKMTGVYSGINASCSSINRLADFLIYELKSITIWHRPEYAISWQGLSNAIPDISMFFDNIRTYLIKINVHTIATYFLNIIKHPTRFIVLLIKLLGLFVCFLLFRNWGNILASRLAVFADQHTGLLKIVALWAVCLLQFLHNYLIMIAIWFVTFVAIHLQHLSDPYIYMLFYLGSIPYLLYLAHRFIKHCIQFNMRYDYVFLEPDFQRRFAIVFTGLLYTTVVIVLFREAFMLGHYYPSELPTILLAVNFIVFQISLILLISKDQIINLIPTRSDMWLAIRSFVNNYYYHLQAAVILVIILGNPYVGFGKLVLYILFGLVYTGFLIAVLLWMHGLFKRVISQIFFVTDEEIVRERFANAKTWFGLFIIISFITMAFLGVIVGGKIWGWPITLSDVVSWFDEPLLLKTSPNPITVRSIFQIIGFILAGFIASYAISTFVLDKIFDLLLVDSGVQYTVTSITQYAVIVIAIFFGLQNVGLGEIIGYFIAALTFSLGWVLREPIGDFVAYFIILVQRPVKMGDFIKINDDIVGVVRKITARSVVIRKKNSVSIIVPNTTILSKSVVNWNYAHNFIAFNDIIIMVDYAEDTQRVKELLLKAVQSHPNVLRSPQPIIRLEYFGDYGYQFMVRGYLSSIYTLEQWDIESDIRIIISQLFRQEGIKIAIRPVGISLGNTLERD